jgi:hypothetical protein
MIDIPWNGIWPSMTIADAEWNEAVIRAHPTTIAMSTSMDGCTLTSTTQNRG